MSTLYSPSQLAQKLDAPVHTVRRYGDRYAAHLSAGARSRPRRYSEQDAAVLGEALRLVQGGHTLAEVDTLLAVTVDVALPAVQASQPVDPVYMPALPTELSTLAGRLSALEVAVHSQQQASRRVTLAFALGVTVGVLLVLLGAAIVAGIVR